MKKTLATVLALVALLAAASPSLATPTGIGIFGNEAPGSVHRCMTVPAFSTFTFYVIGFNLGSFNGWEASLTFSVAGFNVLGTTLNPANALNVGTPGNFIVGLGANFNGSPRYTLVTYQIGWFSTPTAPADVQVCLGGTTPSSFNGEPGYATSASQLVPLPFVSLDTGVYGAGCAVINASNVPNCTDTEFSLPAAQASFGEMKARF